MSATVWLPNDIASPVPATVGVNSVVPLIRVYVTPVSESARPTGIPAPPSQNDPPPVTEYDKGAGGFRTGLSYTIAFVPGVTVSCVLTVEINSATRVGYKGAVAVFAINIRFGVELAAKLTVLVIMKCVRRVPGEEVDIIVPLPDDTGNPAASLIRV
jgi:hypothetical protein